MSCALEPRAACRRRFSAPDPAGWRPVTGALLSASSKPAAKPARFAATATAPARIACSYASRGNGSAPEAANAPNSTELMRLPDRAQAASMSKHTRRRDSLAQRRKHRIRLGDAVAERRFFRDAVDPMAGCHQRGSIRSHESAHHRASRFHEFRGDDHIHIAGHGHERENRAPLPDRWVRDTSRGNTPSSRCAAPRPAPRWTAPASRSAPRPRRSSRPAPRRPAPRGRQWRWKAAAASELMTCAPRIGHALQESDDRSRGMPRATCPNEWD